MEQLEVGLSASEMLQLCLFVRKARGAQLFVSENLSVEVSNLLSSIFRAKEERKVPRCA